MNNRFKRELNCGDLVRVTSSILSWTDGEPSIWIDENRYLVFIAYSKKRLGGFYYLQFLSEHGEIFFTQIQQKFFLKV